MENPSAPTGAPNHLPQAVRIEVPELHQGFHLRFLADTYQGYITHYVTGRTVLCGQSDCPASNHRQRSVWRGYAPGEWWVIAAKVWRPAVLEITESCEEYLRGRQLRGEVWWIERTGKTQDKSQVKGVFCEQLPRDSLRSAFNLDQVLQRFYRVAALPASVRNPLASRVRLADVADAPPALPPEVATPDAPPVPQEIIQKMRQKQAAQENPKPASREQLAEFTRRAREIGARK